MPLLRLLHLLFLCFRCGVVTRGLGRELEEVLRANKIACITAWFSFALQALEDDIITLLPLPLHLLLVCFRCGVVTRGMARELEEVLQANKIEHKRSYFSFSLQPLEDDILFLLPLLFCFVSDAGW
jgi:hypothetical protein